MRVQTPCHTAVGARPLCVYSAVIEVHMDHACAHTSDTIDSVQVSQLTCVYIHQYVCRISKLASQFNMLHSGTEK